MWKEFKDFAMRGNVLDLAVGVIIGGAFNSIVTSLVDNIISPIIGIFSGKVDMSAIFIKIADTKIFIGAFIQSIIDFIIIAFTIFIMIKMVNKLRSKKEEEAEEAPEESMTSEEKLLMEIRDLLKDQKSKES
ncbi:large conductance mechanosensitive channel protein MscL [Alloiococcus sp. CFN-8]|uniref:large conductance mechanosensitive channel protein MscL n=1 Tax=Alloiococcus sp. CFN-8 TaxID=3416081 RepID=UPI003CF59C4A